MNILILGCSYGVPNYFGPPGAPKESHIEFLIREQGHDVHNCSLNGGSNLRSLSRAESYLNGIKIQHPAYRDKFQKLEKHVQIDRVIWFHTELFRDGLTSKEEDLARMTYSAFAKVLGKLNAKIAVIGGAGDLHPCFEEYIQPNFCIPSWRRVILKDSTLPLSNTVFSMHSIPNMNLSTQEKYNLLIKDNIIYDKIQMSEHFSDGCHPGPEPYQQLLDELNKNFLRD